MPPFVVGENTTASSSEGVWIDEENRSTVNILSDVSKTYITGANLKLKTNTTKGVIIAGYGNCITPSSPSDPIFYDAVHITGSNSVIKSDETTVTGKVMWSFATRGVHIASYGLCVFNKKMLQNAKVDDIEKDEPLNCLSTYNTDSHVDIYPLNQGVLMCGRSGKFLGNNMGTIIGGDTFGFNGWNSGLVLSGSDIYATSTTEGDISYKWKNDMKGPGIWISGRHRDKRITLETGESKDIFTNSFVKFSSLEKQPTMIIGEVRLDTNCNIYDATGKVIVKNGIRQ